MHGKVQLWAGLGVYRGGRIVFLFHFWLSKLDLVFDGLPRLLLLAPLLQLEVYLLRIENKQNTLEQPLTDFVRRALCRVLAVKIGALFIGFVQFGCSSTQLLVFGLGLYHDLLTVLIDAIVGIALHLAVEGLLDGQRILLQLGKVDPDLTNRHLGDELVHVHFLLAEDRIGILLPDLPYYVQPRVHLPVLRSHLLQTLQSVQLEAPSPALETSPVEVVPHRQSHLQHVVQPVIGPQRLKRSRQVLYLLLQVEVKLLPQPVEKNRFYAAGIFGNRDQFPEETLGLAQILQLPLEGRNIGLFLLAGDQRFY